MPERRAGTSSRFTPSSSNPKPRSTGAADSLYFLPPAPRGDPFPVDLSSLLDDPDFMTPIVSLWAARNDVLRVTRRLRDQMRETRRQIEAALGGE